MNTQYLSITWSTSKGRDTYGYNICKLSAGYKGDVYKTCGGGYDMVGTVVGQWLAANYQDRLLAIKMQAHSHYDCDGNRVKPSKDGQGLYGMAFYAERQPTEGKRKVTPEHVSLDGACGLSAMQDIAEAIGLSLTATCNRKGHVTGYMVTDYDSAEALQAARK